MADIDNMCADESMSWDVGCTQAFTSACCFGRSTRNSAESQTLRGQFGFHNFQIPANACPQTHACQQVVNMAIL
jgi:hypothetical protein